MSWYADVEIPWHVHYEHKLTFAYHWSPTEINQTPAIDCFGHLILIRRREASEHEFACTAASWVNLLPSARKEISKTLYDEQHTGRRRLTEYEVADPVSRISMIGRSLRLHGEKWANQHAAELAWLESQRVTRDEAIKRSIEWETEKAADDFWK